MYLYMCTYMCIYTCTCVKCSHDYNGLLGLIPVNVPPPPPLSTSQGVAILLNLLGFSVPIPLCISRSLEAQYVALLGFIPPLVVFTEILIFVLG